MFTPKVQLYPLPVTRALDAAEKVGTGDDAAAWHGAVMRLADVLAYYLGAVAVAQYSQALYTGQIETDPTLNRSLRSLRRILPGQWLGWAARGLAATQDGVVEGLVKVEGLAEWYSKKQAGDVAKAYEALRALMVDRLAYTGEYGPQESVSPRTLLEMVDQYRIRRGKTNEGSFPPEFDKQVAGALLPGLREMLQGARFLKEYDLYAPGQRQLLMGPKPTSPMPPIAAPPEAAAAATLLLYPPGEAPDYTKRPDLQAERQPLFPLDPLLAYVRCDQCNRHRVAALREVADNTPTYLGLDPDCGHTIRVLSAE